MTYHKKHCINNIHRKKPMKISNSIPTKEYHTFEAQWLNENDTTFLLRLTVIINDKPHTVKESVAKTSVKDLSVIDVFEPFEIEIEHETVLEIVGAI